MATDVSMPETFGRYRILRKVGEGGMGTVYLAEDTVLGRQVAVKVPHFDENTDPTAVERFFREARSAASLSHPDICPVIDVGQIEGKHYLTMPFVEGHPLTRHLGQKWPVPQACALVRRLAMAVAELHQRGLVHRDLKPANIMMRSGGEPMLMDFGLARSFLAGNSNITAAGTMLGTPAYMPPEQVRGSDTEIGPPTDVYALAVMLYEMLCGRLPFEGQPMSILGKVLNAAPPPPTQFRGDLDGRLEAVLLRAMSKKAAERYASAAEFATALKPFAAAATTGAPRPAAVAAGRSAAQPTPAAAKTPREMPTPSGASIVCASCGKMLRLPAGAEGKKIKCPACQTVTDTAPTPPSRPSRAGDQLQAERPEPPPRSREDTRRSDGLTRSQRPREDDDEDDPRKRQDDDEDDRKKRPRSIRKRKKASGNSAVLWLSIGGGALVLVGVVVLIIVLASGGDSDDKKVVEQPPGGGGDPGALPAGWQTFSPPGGGFRVLMPGNPIRQTQAVAGTQLTMYVYEAGGGRDGCAVGYADMPIPPGAGKLDLESVLNGAEQGMMANTGARKTKSERITVNGHPGRYLEADVPRLGKMRARIYMVDRRMYQVLVMGTQGWTHSADMTRLLDSFALTQ